jgi:drug/metabolite transporter (DMT)-like permease
VGADPSSVAVERLTVEQAGSGVPPPVRSARLSGIPHPMQALAQAQSGNAAAGLLLAALAAVLFAVGAVLQHEAAEHSTSASGLSLRRLVTRPRWVLGQSATLLGTGSQVAALALAPVAVVQPMLAVALVIALGLRAVRTRQAPLRLELLGAGLTTLGLAVFLLAARPAEGASKPAPSPLAVITAVVVSVLLVAVATLLGRGAHGALACGSAAGIAAGIAAVLISVGLRSLREGGWVHALAGSALWGALVVAVVAVLGGQQAYARGSLAWSLPALILLDPLTAVPAARLLLGERLEPGHAAVWLPAAAVAAVGVVVLARTGEPHGSADTRPPVAGAG